MKLEVLIRTASLADFLGKGIRVHLASMDSDLKINYPRFNTESMSAPQTIL